MIELVKVTGPSGDPIFLNPAKVLFLRSKEISGMKYTRITVENDINVDAQESLNHVAKLLQGR